MKKLVFLFVCFCLFSCEEVVDLDLETTEPRLVIEATLLKHSEPEAGVQTIRLSTTAPYFEEEIPPVTGAAVKVATDEGDEFIFYEVREGIYQNDQIQLLENVSYQLEVVYNEEIYAATETFVTTPDLEFVEQDLGGFSGDEYEFKVYYEDPETEENFYLFRYLHEQIFLQIYDDSFTDGNQTFAFFSDEDVEAGDTVLFEIQGISEGFYDYLFTLRSQSGDDKGGPFQSQPSVVRGNIVNQTNPKNFPFGYFRISEINVLTYEVK